MELVCIALTLYNFVLIGRVILSFLPPPQNPVVRDVAHLTYSLTEPVLAPLRGIIPPAGMFDLSVLVLFLILGALRQAVCQGGF